MRQHRSQPKTLVEMSVKSAQLHIERGDEVASPANTAGPKRCADCVQRDLINSTRREDKDSALSRVLPYSRIWSKPQLLCGFFLPTHPPCLLTRPHRVSTSHPTTHPDQLAFARSRTDVFTRAVASWWVAGPQRMPSRTPTPSRCRRSDSWEPSRHRRVNSGTSPMFRRAPTPSTRISAAIKGVEAHPWVDRPARRRFPVQ